MQSSSTVRSSFVLLSDQDFKVPLASPLAAPSAASSVSGDRDYSWTAMSRLAEAEAQSNSHEELVVVVQGQGDLQWLPGLVSRLWKLGRAVVLRLSKTLPRPVARDIARLRGADDRLMIELAIAHLDPKISKLLLGPDSADAQSLLLHAQFLASLDLPMRVRLGALLPGIHDRPGVLADLLCEIRSADLEWVLPHFSALDGTQMAQILELVEDHRRHALQRTLDWGHPEEALGSQTRGRGKRMVSGKLQRRDQWVLRAFVERSLKLQSLQTWGPQAQRQWLKPVASKRRPKSMTPGLFDHLGTRHLH